MNLDVHQVRYRWAPSTLLGTRGMGPVGSTLAQPELADVDRSLRDHVWAVGPEPGFTFLVHQGVGVLVRKVTTAAEDGRSGSAAHVLLSRHLTASRALGLTRWRAWDKIGPGMLRWADLEPAAEDGLEELRIRARALLPDRLAGLFAQLLSAPGDGYTVIGEADPLAVTCALGDLIGQTPTFASDEADDNGPHLPTAVFLRQTPLTTTAATRRRLHPRAEHDEQAVLAFAVAAVEAYTADGVDGILHLRQGRPPADRAQAREWAAAAQFVPGVLADLTRLPKLRPEVLAELARPEGLKRVKEVVRTATSRQLGHALDPRLPGAVIAVLADEAMARVVVGVPGDRSLLDRLAVVAPLPLDLVERHLPSDLDRAAYVAQALLAPEDRRAVLQRVTKTTSFVQLVRWIDERAATDPDGALIMYTAICARARKASTADLWTLAADGGLVKAVRRFSESEQEASARLVQLLAALRGRALHRDVLAELVRHADPILLHALDTVVRSRTKRAVIHRGIRLAFYHSHHLPKPTAPPKDTLAHRTGFRWWRSLLSRPPARDDRKPT